MKCPYCGYEEDKVIDSRPTEEGYAIRRRRECTNCLKRFTTYENIERKPLMVIKKDNSRQVFDSQKLLSRILIACAKRPIPITTLERIVEEVENYFLKEHYREISSKEIGDMVLSRLKEVDDVAYVRFASVYRDFDDVDTFISEIKHLKKQR
ncbi:MAG: transcriptional repressor NrdR [Clostridia bacterium]|nr:transcriptional repressor NrdR [Clostridia bacterium]